MADIQCEHCKGRGFVQHPYCNDRDQCAFCNGSGIDPAPEVKE